MELWRVTLVVLIASSVIVTTLFALPWLTIKLSQQGPNIIKAIGLFLVLALALGLFLPWFWSIPGAFTAALIYFIGSGGETNQK